MRAVLNYNYQQRIISIHELMGIVWHGFINVLIATTKSKPVRKN